MAIPEEHSQRERIVVCSSFPADGIPRALDFWMAKLGFPLRTELAPFNQVFQQLLDPGSFLAANRGVNVIALRLEDLGSTPVAELTAALKSFSSRAVAPILALFTPTQLKEVEAEIADSIQNDPKFRTIRSGEFEEAYGQRGWQLCDSALELFSFNEQFFAAFGALAARKIHGLRRPEHKAIVLDGDETLWRGVCAEDAEVAIDPPRRALQEFVLEQRKAGALIFLASKNREEDVLRVLCKEEMCLRAEDFAALRMNWRSKSENIRSIADEFKIALESIIFVDDNPLEIAEVAANCPGVCALQLPADSKEIPGFLRRVWAFDRAGATREDQVRAEFYQQNQAREEVRVSAPTLEEFLARLELKISFRLIGAIDLKRVAQLTQRTTQFNCSNIRRTEAELAALLDLGKLHGEIANVKDRFGDYGDVGVLLYERAGDSLVIDTLLLSCRALGRGVEEAMLRRAALIAQNDNCKSVAVRFVSTARNEPAFNFLEGAPYAAKDQQGNATIYNFDPKTLLATEGKSFSKKIHTPLSQPSFPVTSTRQIDYQRIAATLSNLDELCAAIESSDNSVVNEIREILSRHPAIREVAVREYERDGKRLAVYLVVDPIRSPRVSGRARFALPNGLAVVEQSRVETEALYQEMFEQRIYFQHGIALRDGDVVIDCGANIGMFTIFAQTSCPNARVYSFEPVPPVFELLRINAGLYAPQAQIFNLGVSEKLGRATIQFHPHLSGASSFFEADADVTDSRKIIERQLKGSVDGEMLANYTDELTRRAAVTERFEAETIGLSEFFRQAGIAQVNLLKVDVEKSEMNLLRGITPEDWPKIDQVVLEVHSDDLRDQCCSFLEDRGFGVVKDQAPERVGTRLSYLYARRNRQTATPLPSPKKFGPPLVTAEELRNFVRDQIWFATPLDFIFLDRLPQSSFPEPTSANVDFDSPESQSENPFHEQLSQLWKEVLGSKTIGVHDDFFAVGGNSGLAETLLARIEETFGIRLPENSVAVNPTIAALSQRLETELISQMDESEIRQALSSPEARA